MFPPKPQKIGRQRGGTTARLSGFTRMRGNMSDTADEMEWRGLIERLQAGTEPQAPLEGPSPTFDEPPARNRVGVVIAKAVLGHDTYQLYRLYCGDPPTH
jgi:hypothetical protein